MLICTLLLALQTLLAKPVNIDIPRNVSQDSMVLETAPSCDDPVYLLTYPEKVQRCSVMI